MTEKKIETGNVVITVEVYDPHRPLSTKGELPAKQKMRLELTGLCALSSVDADEVVEMVGKLAQSDRRIHAQVWHGDELMADEGPSEDECGATCSGRWTGEDYVDEMAKALNYRSMTKLVNGPDDFLGSLLSRIRKGKDS